eukprot:gene7202-8365_t
MTTSHNNLIHLDYRDPRNQSNQSNQINLLRKLKRHNHSSLDNQDHQDNQDNLDNQKLKENNHNIICLTKPNTIINNLGNQKLKATKPKREKKPKSKPQSSNPKSQKPLVPHPDDSLTIAQAREIAGKKIQPNHHTNNHHNNNNHEERKQEGALPAKAPRRRSAHVTDEEARIGIAQGKYFYGALRVNAKKYMDAYVTIDGVTGDAFCGGLKYRNRAFHTDIVVFQVLPESEWKERPKKDEDDDTTTTSTDNHDLLDDDDEDMEVASIKDASSSYCDQGTIAITQSFTGMDLKDREKLEESVIEDDEEEEEEVEGFVMVPTNDAPKSPAPKKQPLGDPNGPTQQLLTLQKMVDMALKKNLYVSCKVVAVLDAKHSRVHVGIITDDPSNSTFANFSPMDGTLPRCLVFKESIPDFRSKTDKYKTLLVAVNYGNWKENSILPIGKYHSIFGECGEIEPETRALLKEFGVDTSPFSAQVMECLPKVKGSWSPTKEDFETRRDLRSHVIVSIDPDTAKDLDDALSCVRRADGNYEVGVHIADVAHFVRPGTELDKCAQERATTVYLVQKAIPMLPSLLSEDLCSLNFGVERYAFSVIWTLTPEGEVIEEWFGRSVIKSASRLTYGMAQTIIAGRITTSWKDNHPSEIYSPTVDRTSRNLGPDTHDHVSAVVTSVLNLAGIARNLRSKRVDRGAFNIHPTKLAFSLDERGNPVDTRIYPIYESNHLVEEFMLLANMRVAQRISKYFPANALLRRHPVPNPVKLQQFIKFCNKHGLAIDSSSVGSFGQSIAALREVTPDPHVFMSLQMLSIRSMRLAEYFCTGEDEDEELWAHYALNVGHYTHFTSPIRRYADIVVHRLLDLSLQMDRATESSAPRVVAQLPATDLVTRVTKHCNDRKLAARKAQERSDKVFLCMLLQHHLTVTEAVVLQGGQSFMVVMVPQFGMEQRVHFDQLQQSKQIQSVKFKDEVSTLVWPGIEATDAPITVEYKQLSTVRVKITVDKSKFPIDTMCTLLHPLYDSSFESSPMSSTPPTTTTTTNATATAAAVQ